MRGQYGSALEHAVPEKFFTDPKTCNSYDNPNPTTGLPTWTQGISSVKALSLAADQGQKIYTITPKVYQRNSNIVSSQLGAHSDITRSRIQNALDQGMEVTIHAGPITESGWKGSGYIILDTQTAFGAYEIEGGAQGAWYSLVAQAVGALFILTGIISLLGAAWLITPIIIINLSYIAVIFGVLALISVALAGDQYDPKCGGRQHAKHSVRYKCLQHWEPWLNYWGLEAC